MKDRSWWVELLLEEELEELLEEELEQ